MMSTELAKQPALQPLASQPAPATAIVRRPMPEIDDIVKMAEVLFKGGIGGSRPQEIATKIIAGWELGLPPIQSCNNIMLVNGRATIYGDLALAIVRASGQLVEIEERIDGEGDERFAVCRVQRRGEKTREFAYSVDDAKRAGLWNGANAKKNPHESPWVKTPNRMLLFRARSTALRDVFTDLLCGLGVYEETIDESYTAEPRQANVVVEPTTVATVTTSASTTGVAVPLTNDPEILRAEIASRLHEYLDRKSMTIDQFREQVALHNDGEMKLSRLTAPRLLNILMEIQAVLELPAGKS